MRFLFIDYTDLVLKEYEEKRDSNQLSQRLMHPTTANIRQECLYVYTERTKNGEKEETDTLRAFFGIPPTGKDFSHNIERCNPDKFRPLQNLIKREIKNPALVNVELLAWLIGVTPRPFSHAQKLFENKNEPISTDNAKTETDEKQPGLDPAKQNLEEPDKVLQATNAISTTAYLQNEGMSESDDPAPGNQGIITSIRKRLAGIATNRKVKIAATIILIIVVLGGGIYFGRQREGAKQTAYGTLNTGCMYWAVDHYEKAPCNEEQKDRLLLPLNEEKIKGFRRIMQEDTITEKSIGKVHYIKRNKTIEYYTTGGNHPIEVTRSLRPLSAYMFDKYLRKQEVANKGLGEGQKFINNR